MILRYDIVYGIGQDCANSDYMVTSGLRCTASPFDWLAGWDAGFMRHVDLICTDFRDFLDLDSLQVLPHPSGSYDDMEHHYCQNRKTGIRFLHDFPIGRTVAESFDSVKKKFDRRIERFYRLISQSANVLFVYWTRTEVLDGNTVAEALARLRKRFPGTYLDLLVMCHDESIQSGCERICLPSGGEIVRGRIYDATISVVKGNVPLCQGLYSRIKVRGKWKRILNRWQLLVRMRIVTAFHLTSQTRRAARDKWRSRHKRELGALT